MLFSKCLRPKIYCNMNGHFDPLGCQTLLLKESELFLLSLGSWTISKIDITLTSHIDITLTSHIILVTHLRLVKFI